MAAVTVAEPQSYVTQALHHYELQSPVGLIRMMIQQSNCFIVVERGAAMENMQQERQLAAAGELRPNSNMGGGQLVTADFVITPSVVFSEHNAGGMGGGVGGVISEANPLAGVLVGGLKFSEAQTSMLLSDARSGVQVAAAEGSTRKADFRLGAALFGMQGFGSAHGYGNTNEGKIIAAAFLDNYKKIVAVVRGDGSLQRDVGTLQEEAAHGGQMPAGEVFNEGDVITPKISNVRLLVAPADGAQTVTTVNKGDELVVIGAEQNGYVYAQGSAASGWAKKVLMKLH
jgi:curli biogenesis system outer membrane secretion channel CsgG